MEIEFKDFNDANNFLKNLLNIDVAMYFKFVNKCFDNIFIFIKNINSYYLSIINKLARSYKQNRISLRVFKYKIAKLISEEFQGLNLKLKTGIGDLDFSEQDVYSACKKAFDLFNKEDFLKFVKHLYENIFVDTCQKLIKKVYLFYKSNFLLGDPQPLNFETFDEVIKESQPKLKKN